MFYRWLGPPPFPGPASGARTRFAIRRCRPRRRGYPGSDIVGRSWGAHVIAEQHRPVALHHQWSFAPEPMAPGEARQRLLPVLDFWGLSEQHVADVLMVVSELVSNAVEHARTPLELHVAFTGSSVMIEVSDGSLVEPELQPTDTSELRGRGLQFVDALARAWSWRPNGHGKTVWAEMAVGVAG